MKTFSLPAKPLLISKELLYSTNLDVRNKFEIRWTGQWVQPVGGVGRRTLPVGVSGVQRGSKASRVRLGYAQHKQPQRAHPQEVMSRSSGVLHALRPAQRRKGAPAASHLRQGTQETARYDTRPFTHLLTACKGGGHQKHPSYRWTSQLNHTNCMSTQVITYSI